MTAIQHTQHTPWPDCNTTHKTHFLLTWLHYNKQGALTDQTALQHTRHAPWLTWLQYNTQGIHLDCMTRESSCETHWIASQSFSEPSCFQIIHPHSKGINSVINTDLLQGSIVRVVQNIHTAVVLIADIDQTTAVDGNATWQWQALREMENHDHGLLNPSLWHYSILVHELYMDYKLCSVQISSSWYLCAQKSPCALYPVSRKFPQCCLWNGSNVHLTDDGPVNLVRSSNKNSNWSIHKEQHLVCRDYSKHIHRHLRTRVYWLYKIDTQRQRKTEHGTENMAGLLFWKKKCVLVWFEGV